MISETDMEKALDFLIETAPLFGQLTEQARLKESMVKHVKALEMKRWNEQTVSAQDREACASQRYLEALTEDAKAAGALAELRARREAASYTIGAWQSLIKANQGPRP